MYLLHPAFVHFSVACVTLGGACEIAGLLLRRAGLARWGGQLLLVGLGSLVPTLVSGYLAANTANVGESGRALLGAHERNGWIVFALLLGTQFAKAWHAGRLPQRWDRWYALALALAVLFTCYNAWIGGQLVFAHGIGVR